MHTSTFRLKFGSLSPTVTLKNRSRSPKPNQLFIMSQCYIHANLVKIHPSIHEIVCNQESVTPTTTGPAPKTISPSPSVGDIILLHLIVYMYIVNASCKSSKIKFHNNSPLCILYTSINVPQQSIRIKDIHVNLS